MALMPSMAGGTLMPSGASVGSVFFIIPSTASIDRRGSRSPCSRGGPTVRPPRAQRRMETTFLNPFARVAASPYSGPFGPRTTDVIWTSSSRLDFLGVVLRILAPRDARRDEALHLH